MARVRLTRLSSMILSTVCTILLASFVTSCESGDKSTTVRGTILDKSTLAPIDSAWANRYDTIEDAAYSNAEGIFSLTSLGRIQKFYAGKEGFNTRLIELPEDEDARQNVIVELEKILGGQQTSVSVPFFESVPFD